ncbi:MAG: DUF853 family protein, partial [Alphaproteobacteria bacterium]|nr:DUF853 family protein [Alphaproteobacteria bacterium]
LKGVPSMVERTTVRPPSSRMGPITPEERQKIVKSSPVYGQYEEAVDRESAYEILQKAAAERVEAAQKAKEEIEAMKAEKAEARSSRGRDSATDRFVKNMAGGLGTTIARSVGNALVRGILGGLTRK